MISLSKDTNLNEMTLISILDLFASNDIRVRIVENEFHPNRQYITNAKYEENSAASQYMRDEYKYAKIEKIYAPKSDEVVIVIKKRQDGFINFRKGKADISLKNLYDNLFTLEKDYAEIRVTEDDMDITNAEIIFTLKGSIRADVYLNSTYANAKVEKIYVPEKDVLLVVINI